MNGFPSCENIFSEILWWEYAGVFQKKSEKPLKLEGGGEWTEMISEGNGAEPYVVLLNIIRVLLLELGTWRYQSKLAKATKTMQELFSSLWI